MKRIQGLVVLFAAFSLCANLAANPSTISAGPQAEAQAEVVPPAKPAPATPGPVAPNGVSAPSGVSAPAMYLNGASYVSVPDASLPAFGDGDLTLEAWVYPTYTTGCHAVFGKDYTQGFWFGICDGYLRFHRGGSLQVQGTTVIPTNRWTHIAVQSYLDASPAGSQYLHQFMVNGDQEDYAATDIGTIHGTRELRIGYDGVNPADYFYGDIAEARVWQFALGNESVRRNMHVAIDEKRPGLYANYHLTTNFKDAMGHADGAAVGSPAFVGYPSPAVPPTAAVDQFFATLPAATYAAATAFVPGRNRAILAGGLRGSVPSTLVTAVDAGTGNSADIGNLPAARTYATAAYAPSNDTVYVFGGSDQFATNDDFTTIYAVNPNTGAVRTVGATLPAGRDGATAVYLDALDKIVVLGGWYYSGGSELYANSVYVFDVHSESISTAAFTLPQAAYGVAAAYSPPPLTGKVYYFGGSPDGGITFDDKGYELTLNADGTGGVSALPTHMPHGDRGGVGVEDPVTHLIYVVNGQFNTQVLAFDPLSKQLWQTPIELPRDGSGNTLARPYSGVVYSARNRHALVIGGGYYTSPGDSNVWRIPLGNGPAVPLGNWDFYNSFVGNIDYMSSVYWRVAMAKSSGVIQYYDSDRLVRYPTVIPSNLAGLTGLALEPYYGQTYFSLYGSNFVQVMKDTGNAVQSVFAESRAFDPGTTREIPGAVLPYADYAPFFGDGRSLRWQTITDYFNGTFSSSFAAPNNNPSWQWSRILAIAHRGLGDAWVLVEPWYDSIGLNAPGPKAAGPISGTAQPNAPPNGPPNGPKTGGPVSTRPFLGRLVYDYYGATSSEYNLGSPCGSNLWAKDLVIGANGDWWVAGLGGVCRFSAIYPPTAYQGNLFVPTIGGSVTHLSVDGDGRVWASVAADGVSSGGLTAYEVLGPANTLGTVRTQDWNWLTAPIGTRYASGNTWDSTIRALTANGERVWMALNTDPLNGPLASFAPRWQQLTGANQGDLWGVRKVFLARGMAFMATNGDRLVALMPDGISWDSRPLPGANAVLGDRSGRIWVGAADGVRRWLPSGWDTINGVLGTPPAGPINALAEDSRGRIWVGGANGLTLYDRERWVTTLPTPFGAISVTALLVDRNDNVWAGTAQGLARLNATDNSWSTFNTANGLFTNEVFSLALLGDGQIAVSTGGVGGGLSLGDVVTGAFTKQNYPPGPNQPLTADQLGRLWAGGILREPTGYYGRFWTNSGLIDSQVVGNAADGADRVWFTHPGGGVSVRGTFLPVLADVQPQINPANGVVPAQGSAGDLITINGSGFGTSKTDVEVDIGGAPTDISTVSDTQIVTRLRGDNLSGDVSVRRGKRRVTLGSPTTPAFCAVPKITSVSPTGGNTGVEMKISGSNFDPVATVQLGGGAPRSLGVKGVGDARVWVNNTDTTGNIVVRNLCPGVSSTAGLPFRKINVTISRVDLNQGYVGFGLYKGNSTLASAFLSIDQPLRTVAPFNDVVQIDYATLWLGPTGQNSPIRFPQPLSTTIPFAVGAPGAAFFADIANAVNIPNVFYGGTGATDVRFEISEHGFTVATNNSSANIQDAGRPRILLVPIMPDGYTPKQLSDFKTLVDTNLADYRFRIYPGGIEPVWSDEVVLQSQVSGNQLVNLGDGGEQSKAGIEFERIRQRYNSDHGDRTATGFGVVPSTIVTGSAAGMGVLGQTNQWQARRDCEDSFWSDVKDFFGFDKGCGPEYPQFLGWGQGDANASRYLAHELGHMMGLVPNGASNFANFGGSGGGNHSRFTELISPTINQPAACGAPGATFNAASSFYKEPGVSEPVVSPISGTQLYNQLGNNNANTPRGKSLLSYACGRTGTDTYFDPADVSYLTAQRFSALRPFYAALAYARAAAAHAAAGQAPAAPEPARIHAAGLITFTPGGAGASASFENVEVKGPEVKTSASYVGSYQLVQYDAGGHELLRWGVLPLGDFQPNHHPGGDMSGAVAAHPEHADASGMAMFSANVPQAPGVARIALLSGTQVLASYTAGTSAPQVAVTSPTAGQTFNSGNVPVAWTVTNPGGGRLEVAVEFSKDGGATWTPMANAHGSGNASLPVARLAGSSTARIRVWASNGFLSGTATSALFSVAPQPPLVAIALPDAGASVLENQPLPLQAQASDPQDGVLTSTAALTWRSNRDGALGGGSALNVLLSAGTHTITLQATDSAGLTATAQVTVSVVPNYAGDGIPDSQKQALGLNVLSSRDAFSDTNGNGFTYLSKLHFGTDPVAGLPPDALSVWPLSMTFTVDLSVPGQLPQQVLQANSRAPVSVTFSTNVPWIDFSAPAGRTPAVNSVVLNPILLQQGTMRGIITATSSLGTVAVPVTVKVTNKAFFCNANGDGQTNFADVAAIQARVGAVAGQPNYDYHYDLNRDGIIDATDVSLARSCVAIYGNVRRLFVPRAAR